MKPIIYIKEISDWDQHIYKGQEVHFICKECGKDTKVLFRKQFLSHYKEMLCGQCSKEKTFTEKYGCKNPMQNKDIKAKMEFTMRERYGVSAPLQNNELKQKAKNTCMANLGVDNPLKSEKVKEKIKQTNLNKYGVEYAIQSKEVQDKIKKSILDKYGVSNVFQNEDIKEKARATLIKKYGVDNIYKLDEFIELRKQTNLKKYGVENPFQSEEVKQKIKESNIKKYGYEYPMQSPQFKAKLKDYYLKKYGVPVKPNYGYLYDDIYFDSSWELAFYIFHKDLGMDISRCDDSYEYTFNNETHYYYPDFKMENRIYEIKGDQFFDKDNKMICPFDHSKDDLFESKHQCMLQNKVTILRQKDVEPYLWYVERTYGKDYMALYKVEKSI